MADIRPVRQLLVEHPNASASQFMVVCEDGTMWMASISTSQSMRDIQHADWKEVQGPLPPRRQELG